MDDILAGFQQAGQGAFPPPALGMGPPAAPPVPPAAPLPGAPPMGTPPPAEPVPGAGPPGGPPGLGLAAADPLDPLEPELEVENPDEIDDELGSGAHPRQSGTTVRRGEHPLQRAALTIQEELKGQASRLAGELFPSGPAGAERLSKPAFDAYVKRHWDEPEFRASLLERMAPKGPDGKRLPSGVKQFNALYKEVIEPGQVPKNPNQPPAFVPPGQASPQPAPPPPQPQGMPFQPPMPLPAAPPPGPEAGMVPPPGPNVLPPG